MTGFLALLRLQLLSRYSDLRPKNWKHLASKEQKKAAGKMLLYIAVFLYLGGALFFIEIKIMDLLLKMGRPPMGMADLMVILAVGVSMIGTLVMSFFFVMSSLYLGRDSVFLASLPLKPRTLLTARLCQIWISETCINALILLPACILFGVRTGADPLFYVRMIVVWLFCSMLPICLGTVFSTMLVRASALLRHREAIMTVGGMAFMVLYMWGAMSIGTLTGDNGSGSEMLAQLVSSNTARIQTLSRAFPPMNWAVRGMLGDWGMLALFAAVSIAAVAALIWLLGIFYRRLSLIQAETPTVSGRKGLRKGAFSGTGNALTALMKREIKQILRVPSYATNILPICLMPVLMIIVMFVFIGRNFSDNGKSLEMLLNEFPSVLSVGFLSLLICFMAELNPALSTAVSREGRGHDFMLGLPIPVRTHLLSKLLVGYALGAFGVLGSAIALVIFVPYVWKEVLAACIISLLFIWMCACLSLARDVKKPKLNWVTEQEAVKQNYGLLLSMLVSFALLATLGLLSYVLIAELDFDTLAYTGTLAAVIAAGGWLSYRHLMKTGDKYYLNHKA